MTIAELAPPQTTDAARQLEALRNISFDWTMHLRGVWNPPPYDSAEIHTDLREQFRLELSEFKDRPADDSPPGWLVTGPAGSGKTHWLSFCREQAIAMGFGFVLVDMTDVRSFWDTVLQGFLDSLQQELAPGRFQQAVLIERFLTTLPLLQSVDRAYSKLSHFPPAQFAQNVEMIVTAIRRKHPVDSLQNQDVIRALLATANQDNAVSSAGYNWLRGNPIDEETRKQLRFASSQERPERIVRALSWMMSLCGPTVLAFDQLDPIVAQLDPAARAQKLDRDFDAQELTSLSIIREIANGLGAMYDLTYRTLTVVACLESSYSLLQRYTLATWQDRFVQPPSRLSALQSRDAAAAILFPRTQAGCAKVGYSPPWPTWPIASEALDDLHGLSPRELLKLCDAHRRSCLRKGVVEPLRRLVAATPTPAPTTSPIPTGLDAPTTTKTLSPTFSALDAEFARLKSQADVPWLLEQSCEDDRFAPLLLAGCRCLVKEIDWPHHIDSEVDAFPGGKTTKPLHARIRVIDRSQSDQERHFSFRTLQRMHPIAFQARLRAAIDGSGIDARLPFRTAIVLRTTELPKGPETKKLLDAFDSAGGLWHHPKEDEVRSLYALTQLLAADPPGFEEWLQKEQPASRLAVFQRFQAALSSGNAEQNAKSEPVAIAPARGPAPARNLALADERAPAVEDVSPETPPSLSPPSTAMRVAVRKSYGADEFIEIPAAALAKHMVVLAGAGSGKTVLLKRVIEEAAIAGVPSIVIDGANDLAGLGLRRSTPSPYWLDGDAQRAKAYHDRADVVVWTPGREQGNPLRFEPLPNLVELVGEPDELRDAIDMVVDSIGSFVTGRSKASADHKLGILRSALGFLAQRGVASIDALTECLRDLPTDAGPGINNQDRLAKQMADELVLARAQSPILRGHGEGVDFGLLFGDRAGRDKTRISVINFAGLSAIEQQQIFVNQLAMGLFAWIKKRPSLEGRPLRGLFVLDEAKDFAPSGKSTPCKENLRRLAAQARKYHVGVIFATQTPKDVDNRIIGNCSTQFLGKASSPEAQETIRKVIQRAGGDATDVGGLPRGAFYLHNADLAERPRKVQCGDCYSDHHTLGHEEIFAMAEANRGRLGGRS